VRVAILALAVTFAGPGCLTYRTVADKPTLKWSLIATGAEAVAGGTAMLIADASDGDTDEVAFDLVAGPLIALAIDATLMGGIRLVRWLQGDDDTGGPDL
jgi:hypothetical protein